MFISIGQFNIRYCDAVYDEICKKIAMWFMNKFTN